MKKCLAVLIAFTFIFVFAFVHADYMVESEEDFYEVLHFMFPAASFHVEKDKPLIYAYEVLDDGTAKIIKIIGESDRSAIIPDSVDGIPVSVIGTEAYTFFWPEELIIPEGIREIESQAFYTVKITDRIYLPSTLAIMGAAPFYNFDELEGKIVIDENNARFAIQDNCLVDLAEGRLIQYLGDEEVDTFRIPDGIRIIGEKAFSSFARINHILLPESVLEIREEAFLGHLESIHLPGSLTRIASPSFFRVDRIDLAPDSSCFTLENGVLFDREKTRLIYATSECTDIEYHVPVGVQMIDDYAFRYFPAQKIYLPAGLEEFSASAFPALGGKYVDFDPDQRWFRLENGIVYSADGSRLVYCCRDLEAESITIPEGVREIGPFAFASMSEVKHIILPATLEKIGRSAFANCRMLEDIIIPDFVRTIEKCAFLNCTSLRKLIIPKEAIHLEKGMFRNDENNLIVCVYSGSYAESFMNCGLYMDFQYDRPVSVEVLPQDG